MDSGPLGPALSSRQSFRKFTDGRITHRCVTLRWSNYGSRTRGPSVLHDQHLIRPCVGFAEVRALNSRSRGHGFDSHPLPIPLKPVKRDKATTRQSGILCGWSASEMTYIVSSGALNSTHSLTRSPGTVYHWTFVRHRYYQRSETCSRHIFSHVPTSLTNCFQSTSSEHCAAPFSD